MASKLEGIENTMLYVKGSQTNQCDIPRPMSSWKHSRSCKIIKDESKT